MRELRNLDWEEILHKLEKLATSEPGRHILRGLAPLSTKEAAQISFSQIQEAQFVLSGGHRCFMESLDLFGLWFQRLEKGATLKTLELKDVRHFCLEAMALKEILRPHQSAWLKSVFERLMDPTEPLSAIDQIMTPEGEIRTDASETLYNLNRERANQSKAVQQILDRIVKQHESESLLQDRYVTNREGRWVLPVKSGLQHHFDGIIHASSQTKQTVFMEPKEIIPINNRLRQIEVEIEEEVERLLTDLSKYLSSQLSGFTSARDLLLESDVRFAQGQLALQLEAKPCIFDDEKIQLKHVRHPILALNDVAVVPNDVFLTSDRRLLLLSGPNAGGKTVLLKAVGLAAHMARCGLPICAQEGSRLPRFESIHVAVGDSQSVDAQLSTFAAHLKVLNESARVSGPQHLLLIDEICGSTDPEEGSALARSFIERFSKNKVFGVVTSHLGPLKLGWKPDSAVVNGSLEYDNSTGRPTYQFLMGVPGQSLAIQTARRVGVEQEIIDRAMANLSPDIQRYQMGLTDVDNIKNELRQLREDLDKQLDQAKKEKAKYTALADQFANSKNQMLDQVVRRAEKKIDTLIDHARVDDVFRRHENLTKTKFDLPDVIKASMRPAAAAARPVESADDFAEAFPPGSKVFVPSIGRDGVVQGKPNNRGEVPVLANSMRVMLPWDQLKPPKNAPNPTRDIVRRTSDAPATSPLESDRVIDVRGLNVNDAIQQLEAQLDVAALHNEDRLKIIHGHGTEALKKGLRNYLSRSLYVKKWSVGTNESGGDGVTWVELKD